MIIPTIVVNRNTAHAVIAQARKDGTAVDIMRPSKWGNPFVMPNFRIYVEPRFRVRSRDEAVRKHAEWLHEQPALMQAIADGELTSKVLICCCSPKRCHGEELARLANAVRL